MDIASEVIRAVLGFAAVWAGILAFRQSRRAAAGLEEGSGPHWLEHWLIVLTVGAVFFVDGVADLVTRFIG
jgi:hypothetical protein